jgi:hypothetical protein
LLRRHVSTIGLALGVLMAQPMPAWAQSATVDDGQSQVTEPGMAPSVDPADMSIPSAQRGGPLSRLASPQSAVDLALASAADQLGTSPDQVSVVDVQATEWPDFRLGCPGPDPKLRFAQVAIPGFIVQVQAGDTRLTYHTDFGLRAVLCDSAAANP